MKELRSSNEPHTVVRKYILTTSLTVSILLLLLANVENTVASEEGAVVSEKVVEASSVTSDSLAENIESESATSGSNSSITADDKLLPPSPGERRKIGVSSGDVMQLLLGMLVVIAAIFLMAWLAKKLQLAGGGGHGKIALSGGLSLGGKERLVIARVGNKEFLLGVTPHSINKLAEMECSDLESISNNQSQENTGKDFSETLKNIISRGLSK